MLREETLLLLGQSPWLMLSLYDPVPSKTGYVAFPLYMWPADFYRENLSIASRETPGTSILASRQINRIAIVIYLSKSEQWNG